MALLFDWTHCLRYCQVDDVVLGGRLLKGLVLSKKLNGVLKGEERPDMSR